MPPAPEITRATPEDAPQLAENTAWAFGSVAADMLPWVERIGYDNIRVLREKGRVAAQLAVLWMGQYFGGASVPMAGVAAVAVPPDRRGYGQGTTLIRAILEEARAAGYPLSGLYPATQPVYRAVGYEQAGSRWEVTIAAAAIETKDRHLDVAPMEPADEAEAAQVYAERARRHEGHLDRGPYLWGRIYKPRGEPPKRYRIMNGDRMEGYVVLTKETNATMHADFFASDLVALTPAAQRRILTLFADHRSLANEFYWYGTPGDPLLLQLREQRHKIESRTSWMLRILDVTAALSRRGYPPGVTGELHLRVDDPLFPENSGDVFLEVADGRGQARPGGRGSFRIGIRGLAPLYSGYLTAPQLRDAGFCDAPESELAAARLLFAGPAPWMPDMF